MVGAQWYFDHLKHLHALEFQLEDCICQCDFGRISLRMMLYVPPMSLLKSACKRQIRWCGRDIHKSAEHIEKARKPSHIKGLRAFKVWCRWRGSNPHGLLAQRILSPPRLPIPTRRLLLPHFFKRIKNYNLNTQKNQVFFNKITVHNLFKTMKIILNVLNRQKYRLCRLLCIN